MKPKIVDSPGFAALLSVCDSEVYLPPLKQLPGPKFDSECVSSADDLSDSHSVQQPHPPAPLDCGGDSESHPFDSYTLTDASGSKLRCRSQLGSTAQHISPPFERKRSKSFSHVPRTQTLAKSRHCNSPAPGQVSGVEFDDEGEKLNADGTKEKIGAENGGSSCHQCKSRRKFAELKFCTWTNKKKNKTELQCRKKYCEHCLTKFYTTPLPTPEDLSSWVCPSCRYVCCCAACRRKYLRLKAKGSLNCDGLTMLAEVEAQAKASGVYGLFPSPRSSSAMSTKKLKSLSKSPKLSTSNFKSKSPKGALLGAPANSSQNHLALLNGLSLNTFRELGDLSVVDGTGNKFTLNELLGDSTVAGLLKAQQQLLQQEQLPEDAHSRVEGKVVKAEHSTTQRSNHHHLMDGLGPENSSSSSRSIVADATAVANFAAAATAAATGNKRKSAGPELDRKKRLKSHHQDIPDTPAALAAATTSAVTETPEERAHVLTRHANALISSIQSGLPVQSLVGQVEQILQSLAASHQSEDGDLHKQDKSPHHTTTTSPVSAMSVRIPSPSSSPSPPSLVSTPPSSCSASPQPISSQSHKRNHNHNSNNSFYSLQPADATGADFVSAPPVMRKPLTSKKLPTSARANADVELCSSLFDGNPKDGEKETRDSSTDENVEADSCSVLQESNSDSNPDDSHEEAELLDSAEHQKTSLNMSPNSGASPVTEGKDNRNKRRKKSYQQAMSTQHTLAIFSAVLCMPKVKTTVQATIENQTLSEWQKVESIAELLERTADNVVPGILNSPCSPKVLRMETSH